MKTTNYEWTIETVDSEGEIIDVDFSDTKPDITQIRVEEGNKIEIALVRDNYSDGHERLWAYLDEKGNLPEYFEDAYGNLMQKVPKKYLKDNIK